MTNVANQITLSSANSHDAAYTALLKTVAGSRICSDTLMLHSLESVLRFIGPKTSVAMQRGERSRGMAPSGIAARRVGHTIVFESLVGGIVCVRVYNARGVCVGQADRTGQRRVSVPIHGLGQGVYLATIMLNNGSGHGALRVIID